MGGKSRKEINDALIKLLLAKETEKLEIVKKLIKNYLAVNDLEKNLSSIPYCKDLRKYGSNYVEGYLEEKLIKIKECLIGVIKAMVKDKEIDHRLKKRMVDDDDDDD